MQKTAVDMRMSDWSSDVCSSDLPQFRSSGGSSGWRRSREFEGAIPCLVTPDQARGDEESKTSFPLPNRVTPPSGNPIAARGSLIRSPARRYPMNKVLLAPLVAATALAGGCASTGYGYDDGYRGGGGGGWYADDHYRDRSEEHTSELQSLMRISYAVFCLKKK